MKRIHLSIQGILCLLLNLSVLSAQWVPTNGPYGGKVTCMIADSANLYLGTDHAGIFKSNLNESGWRLLSKELTDITINAIAISGANLLAGTEGDGLFLSEDKGLTWTKPGFPHPYITSFISLDTTIYASTWDGVYVSHNHGRNWKSTSLKNLYVSTLYSDGANLIAGTYNHSVYISSDTAKTWTSVDSNKTDLWINAVYKDSSDFFAASDDGLFILNDSSKTWELFGLSDVRVTAITKSDSVLVAGTTRGIFLSADIPGQWRESNSGLLSVGVTVLTNKDKKIFTGLYNRGVCVSDDGGQTWNEMNNGLSNTAVYAIASTDTSVFAATYGQGIFSSKDGGENWIESDSGLTNSNFMSIAVSDSFVLAGAGLLAPYGGIFRSTNKGITWKKVTEGDTDDGVFCFTMLDSFVFAGSWFANVFVSSNYGKDWSVKKITSAVAVVRGLAFIGIRLYAATDGQGVYISTDYGETWRTRNTGLTNKQIVDLIYTGGSTLIAGTQGGGIFRSTNYAQSWEEINNGLTSLEIGSLASIGDTLFAGTIQGGVFVSTDNGDNWTEYSLDIKSGVASMTISGDKLYAGTFASGVWRRPISEMVTSISSPKPKFPLSFSLDQNYPNPFNPVTTIRYSIPEKTLITIDVYNAIGKKVKTLFEGIKNSGEHSILLDGSNLSSGIYFVQMTSAGFRKSIKTLLIK